MKNFGEIVKTVLVVAGLLVLWYVLYTITFTLLKFVFSMVANTILFIVINAVLFAGAFFVYKKIRQRRG